MKNLCVVPVILLGLAACASKQPVCEDIVEVNRQMQECEQLSKQMQDNRYPQQALVAKKRFETACVDLRYQRDDYDTICRGDESKEQATLPQKRQ